MKTLLVLPLATVLVVALLIAGAATLTPDFALMSEAPQSVQQSRRRARAGSPRPHLLLLLPHLRRGRRRDPP